MEGMPQLPRKGVPECLKNPNDELYQLVVATGDISTAHRRYRREATELTRGFIQQACPHYKKSLVDDLLCRSGEDTGRAYRGRTCHGCMAVGQFTAKGMFLGEIAPSAASPVAA
jgi:hypothetical protein